MGAQHPSYVSALMLLMVPNNFGDDEIQKLLGEFRVEIGALRQVFEPRDLFRLTGGIGRRKVVRGFQLAHRLCVFEALAQRVDQDRIESVDALAVLGEDLLGAVNDVFSQEHILSA